MFDGLEIEQKLMIFNAIILFWEIFFWIMVFLIGASVGSFLGVIVYRRYIEKKDWETTLFERSHCNNCDHVLSLWELVPIISYFCLGRKCKKCKTKIGIFHLLMEVVTAVDLLTVLFVFFWREILNLFNGGMFVIFQSHWRMLWALIIFIFLCIFQVRWHAWLYKKIRLAFHKRRLNS